MAVNLSVDELSEALRVGDSSEETAHMARLLEYSTEAVSRHLTTTYATTPETVVNEAVIRLAAYLYDKPHVNGAGAADQILNSGAGAILLPYRVHRAGVVAPPAAPASTAAAADLASHAADPDAHHIPPTSSYVLPAAAPGVRGGVQAVTNAIIDADTSTGIFGWAISHVKRVIIALVPAWARDDTTPIPANKLTNAGAPGGGRYVDVGSFTINQTGYGQQWLDTGLALPADADWLLAGHNLNSDNGTVDPRPVDWRRFRVSDIQGRSVNVGSTSGFGVIAEGWYAGFGDIYFGVASNGNIAVRIASTISIQHTFSGVVEFIKE